MRRAGKSVGGYYPTPQHLVPVIASYLSLSDVHPSERAFFDPCAGKGEAIGALIECLVPETDRDLIRLYAIEAEVQRAKACEALARTIIRANYSVQYQVVQSDAFCVSYVTYDDTSGANVLFLNPPYDHDKSHKRLEQKFLDRFTPAVVAGGVLIFLIPSHVLRTCAPYLNAQYHRITCHRFPDGGDWEQFKQVVVFAMKRDTPSADTDGAAVIASWADDPMSLPILTQQSSPMYRIRVPALGLRDVLVNSVDIDAVRNECPFSHRLLGLSKTPEEIFRNQFLVAQPLRPGHIAQALAVDGILSGQELRPDDPNSSLPRILVNATFEKIYRDIDIKYDKEGNPIGRVQVERPVLTVVALDLETYQYYHLAHGTTPTGHAHLRDFNVADLLAHYSRSLGHLLREQCPPLYDPGVSTPQPLCESPRTLYPAQFDAVQTVLALLDKGDNPFLLGEVGVGKSTMGLISALTYLRKKRGGESDKRILVLCPPHLVTSWTDQVAAVLPGARTVVLDTIADLHTHPSFTDAPGGDAVVFILTSSTAKLGSAIAVATVDGRCPSCGEDVTYQENEIVGKRLWCERRALMATDHPARLARQLANLLLPCLPRDADVAKYSQHGRIQRKKFCPWEERAERVLPLLDDITELAIADPMKYGGVLHLLLASLPWHISIDERIKRIVQRVWVDRIRAGSRESYLLAHCLVCMHDVPYASELARRINFTSSGYHQDHIYHLLSRFSEGNDLGEELLYEYIDGSTYRRGSVQAAAHALRLLAKESTWEYGRPCHTPLWQVTPQPRRYPLATYISRYAPKHLRFHIILQDEGHEYRTIGSAQERAAHRLCEGIPTILLSGSIAPGKASGLFMTLWGNCEWFRADFGRDDVTRFIATYGYQKRFVEDVSGSNAYERYGSHTDRVENTEDDQKVRKMGESAGVLPSLLLRLCRVGVWMGKGELVDELPPYHEERVQIMPDPSQYARYDALETAVVKQITNDKFVSGLAGVLYGALTQVASYPDRCTNDTGNVPGSPEWLVQYPADVVARMGVEPIVTRAALFPAHHLLPKERWLVENTQKELDEDRNVVIFVQHTRTGLVSRLQRILREAGIASTYLDTNKVGTRKRETWINEQIAMGCRVLMVNPTAVQTGLNCLTHWCTVMVYETINDAIKYRQALGRFHRPGQTRPVRVFALEYEGTSQGHILNILAMKLKASLAADGLDTSAALSISGAGDDDDGSVNIYELGQALYHIRMESEPKNRVVGEPLSPRTQIEVPSPHTPRHYAVQMMFDGVPVVNTAPGQTKRTRRVTSRVRAEQKGLF